MKYKIKEITPKELLCLVGTCNQIYGGIREITTEKILACGIAACPSSYEATKEGEKVYLIVGKTVNPNDAGLEKRVGEGETLIEVPRELIDNRRK